MAKRHDTSLQLIRIWAAKFEAGAFDEDAQAADRGSQYASGAYRELLVAHNLAGSVSRRGIPYDNAKAEGFVKTLKVESVYLAAYESFEDVTADPPRFIDEVYNS